MKNKQRNSTLLTALLAFMLPVAMLCAQGYDEAPTKTESPYFVVISDHGETDALPLKSTTVDATVVGSIADVTVRQTYVNSGKHPLEAIYTFPLSTRAAVYAMQMTIGTRTITAKIEEKKKAREDYEKAKEEGKRASLLEQSRPNVFTMNVSNIMVGDTIEVLLRYTELLVPEKGVYSFVYPTVVGPRYTGKNSAKDGESFAAAPYTHAGVPPTFTFGYNLSIRAGLPVQEVGSTSHKVKVDMVDLRHAEVTLDSSERLGSNRDIIVNYSLRGNAIESGAMLYEGADENFFLMMVQPPKRVNKADIPPREYIFIVDVSGSMWGFPMEITKKLMRNLIVNLEPTDRFNVVLFSSNLKVFSPSSVEATPSNVERAQKFIEGGNNWSGTEVLDALRKAYALPLPDQDMARTFVIATDGYVTVERECFEMIRKNCGNTNFFAFGIGSSVNRYLIEGMAFAGGGEPFIVTKESEASVMADRFRQYISTPVLTRIKFSTQGFNAYDVEPKVSPDMMAERPILIFGKYKGKASGKLTVSGKVGRKPWSTTVDLAKLTPDTANSALRYLWARERIKYLDYLSNPESNWRRDEQPTDSISKEILGLGLKYNLMTNYTSFVAIDEVVVNKDGKLERVQQPQPMPEGVSDFAIGHARGESGMVKMSRNVMKTNRTNGIHNNNVVTLDAVAEEEITDNPSGDEVFVVVETMPEFPGGMDSLMAFLHENIVYPQEARVKKISGKVFVSFTVEKDGSLSDIKILRDLGYGCGNEVLRVLRLMPRWKPGMQQGKPVRCQFTLPVMFKLDDSEGVK
ncbi:MAG: TonB family protein [Bacteroidales bacterium]|nr:TonB family protein [Bacteroidales bacterium]